MRYPVSILGRVEQASSAESAAGYAPALLAFPQVREGAAMSGRERIVAGGLARLPASAAANRGAGDARRARERTRGRFPLGR